MWSHLCLGKISWFIGSATMKCDRGAEGSRATGAAQPFLLRAALSTRGTCLDEKLEVLCFTGQITQCPGTWGKIQCQKISQDLVAEENQPFCVPW